MITEDILDGVDAVIVDWDGTVAESQHVNFTALNQALHPHGVQLDRHWYRERAGLSIIDLLSEIVAVHGDLPTADVIAASRRQLLAGLHQLQPVPATVDLLERAHDRGLPCAVASGAVLPLVIGGIRVLRLGHLFTAVITGEEVPNGKPAPDLYLHAAACLGADPHRCLAIDDAVDGIAAAHAAGMRVLTLHHQHLCWPAMPSALDAGAARPAGTT
jgi:HAD superfamily hydrolase (TIGR01509 family)